jgi:hypothetical protein
MAKKEKKPKTKKSNKDALAAGAADIKKAEQEAADSEPLVLEPLTRSVEEIFRDRVTMMSNNLGVVLDDNTTIEENLAILDHTNSLSDHVGFMIGDILNFGQGKWGTKYSVALNQTGRALSTLKGYAEASRRIPAEQRQAALSFSQHREILRLPDEKMAKVLAEVGEKAEKAKADTSGKVKAPTVAELRVKIQKLTPKKVKTPKKRTTSGKGKKGGKKTIEVPPYQPNDEEQAKLDQAEEALSTARDAIKSSKLYQIVGRLDNKEKKRWLEMAQPIVDFFNAVDYITGY